MVVIVLVVNTIFFSQEEKREDVPRSPLARCVLLRKSFVYHLKTRRVFSVFRLVGFRR